MTNRTTIANKPVPAKMFLVDAVPGGKAIKIKTDDEGLFFFSQLDPQTNYYLFAQSLDKKEKINIKVLQNGVGYNPSKAKELMQLVSLPVDFGMTAPVVPAVAKTENKKRAGDNLFMPGFKKNSALEEVVVVGFEVQRKKDLTGSITVVGSKEISFQDNWGTLLQAKIAGLQINGNANPGGDIKIAIRGNGSLSANNTPPPVAVPSEAPPYLWLQDPLAGSNR